MIEQTFKRGASRATVQIFSGDTVTLRAYLEDADGEELVLTTETPYLYAKRDIASATPDITVTGSVVGTNSNIVDFALTSTHTATPASYLAEIELNSGTGLDETLCVFNLNITRGIN
jgi:hypothetical protein